MKQREIEALASIQQQCEKITRDVASKTFSDFISDELLYEAILWRIIVIGEAANRISPEILEGLPREPLRAAIGTRHRVIHGYDSVDAEIIYEIVTIHVPALCDAIAHKEISDSDDSST